MPFKIPLRRTWEINSPAVLLNPGETIVGPAEILSQFQFLAQIPFDFSRVESTIQTNYQFNTQYKDKLIDQNPYIKTTDPVYKKEEVSVENVEELPMNEETKQLANKAFDSIISKEEVIEGLDFDPKEVNWVTVKVDQLERACKYLKINIDFLKDKRPKEKKWELVKLVKSYYKI
jgi:hypothetical protein